jgi:hypothetical protein
VDIDIDRVVVGADDKIQEEADRDLDLDAEPRTWRGMDQVDKDLDFDSDSHQRNEDKLVFVDRAAAVAVELVMAQVAAWVVAVEQKFVELAGEWEEQLDCYFQLVALN